MIAGVQRAAAREPGEDVVTSIPRSAAWPDPGMKPPYFFMLSATSVGLNVIGQ